MSKTLQKEIAITPKSRGFHLITSEIMKHFPELSEIRVGVCHIFIKHTSASLTINENADPTVREDLEQHMSRMIPEEQSLYSHTAEGSDDMPAHIKASLFGSSLQVPISGGKLNLGTWQGIYLCEHRNRGGSRKLVLTAFGV